MMNRHVLVRVLVRDHYKQLVIEAFTNHRYKYGVDDNKITEYIYNNFKNNGINNIYNNK